MTLPTDKPLTWSPRCASCGKAKNQHRANTLECPRGKRTTAGYAGYGPGRWEGEMTIKSLRSQHAHALKMLRCTNGNRGWARAVARLNREIMERCRPVFLSAQTPKDPSRASARLS